MRIFITTIFSLLLLATFIAPVVVDTNSIDAGIAFAQSEENIGESEERAGLVGRNTIIPAMQFFGSFFITIGAFVLWLSGILFNYGIQYGIIEFAQFANISGVPVAWTILRDLTNVFFIFIFLAIGIGTILNLQGFGYKKRLPLLLIVAVLINFSLFFAKVGIDVAHGFAGAILNQSGVVAGECSSGGLCSINYGPSTAFLQQFGFVDIVGNSADQVLGAGGASAGIYESIFSGDSYASAGRALLFGILSFIFMTAAGIVFFAGAMILIMRIVKLILLMITAAPAMAAMVIPHTEKYWKMWYKTFIQEAIYAPSLLLLLSISLLFLNTARGTFGPDSNTTASFAEVFINGNSDSVSMVIFFLIALGFLFISIKAAGDMGGMGAQAIQDFASRRTTALSNGTVGVVGRNTLGQASAQGAKAFAKSGLARTGLGRVAMGGLKSLSNATYDPRSAPGAAAAAGSIGADLGRVGPGFVDRAAAASKTKVQYAQSLKNTKEEEETKTLLKTEIKAIDPSIKTEQRNVKDQKDIIKDRKKEGDTLGVTAAEANLKRAEDALAKAQQSKKVLQEDLSAVENAPQLEYAKNLEKEAALTREGSIFNNEGFTDEERKHYKLLEEELKGLRKDLKNLAGPEREEALLSIASKNRELHEFAKDNQVRTTTLLSNVAFATGGLAATAQGNIDAATELRKASLSTKSANDNDSVTEAVKEAIKEAS